MFCLGGDILVGLDTTPMSFEFKQFLGQQQTRRTFLGRGGVGTVALASLLNPFLLSAAEAARKGAGARGVVDPLHYRPKAKRVIWLTMAGGAVAPGDVRL